MPRPSGLTSSEAQLRLRRGEGNQAVSFSSRSYLRILRTNLFNLYNGILFAIGAALLAFERYSDAVISVGIGLLNAVISSVQEIRARRQLDRLQREGRDAVLVIRDGQDTEIDPDQVVRGDVIRLRPGSHVVVDGPVVEGVIEIDESLLTGEAGTRRRARGEELLSGSQCVGGGGLQLAREVGASSRANQLAAQAHRHPAEATPLQRQVSFCVRLIIVLVALMTGAILLQAALEGLSLVRVVQISAVLSGLVPYGLFLLIVIAYTTGAVIASRRGALVQRVNAVESLSTVDLMCLDKTGTLTTGRLEVVEVLPLNGQPAETVETALGSMARTVTETNPTTAALIADLPGSTQATLDEVAFTSSRRWSAVRTASAIWVLGAAEALAPVLDGPDLTTQIRARTRRGLRVLIFAGASETADAVRDATGEPMLPALEPVALVALAEQLRPDSVDTLAQLQQDGVGIKIISGDDPDTVAALAVRAGLGDGTPAHGGQLVALDEPALDALVATTTVFGRVDPDQKVRIVTSLCRRGHYVAMVGDGVNDVGALQAAHVGVAMRSGSTVARDAADVVLIKDSLAVLLPTRREGRSIISGIATSTQLFLTRVATQALIIVTVTMLGLGFPYSPAQTGLTLFTVGLPTLFLTAWAPPAPPDRNLLLTLARFVLPASVLTTGGAVGIYTFLYTTITRGFDNANLRDRLATEFQQYTDLTYGVDDGFVEAAATIGAQTGLSTFVSMASILLVLFLRPPARVFAAWTPPTADKRPAILVVALLAGLLAALIIPVLRTYFGLTRPANVVYETAVPVLVVWFLALAMAYRFRIFDRLLGLKVEQPAVAS